MKNRLYLNLALAALVIVLAVFVFTTQQQPTETTQTLSGLNIKDINEIAVGTAQGHSFLLKKTEKEWIVSQPFTAKALSHSVERLLKISQIPTTTRYPLEADQLHHYGLEQPTAWIRFNQTKLNIGKTEHVQQRRYVSLDQQLMLLDDTFLHLLTQDPERLADTQLIDHQPITSIQTSLFQLQQQDDLRWANLRNIEIELPADRVQQFLDEWRYARAIAVHTSLQADTPSDRVVLTFGDESQRIFTVYKQDNYVFLKPDNNSLFYQFSLQKFNQLMNPP